MNNQNNEESQRELRKKIAEIHKNQSISPAEKQRLTMNLLNSFNSNVSNPTQTETKASTISPSDNSGDNVIDGECSHYQRGCLLQCTTCKKFAKCRLCHDAVITDHHLDRFAVNTIKCKKCQTLQAPSRICIIEECKNIFGEYYCDICHLFENNTEKEIYHCVECGICRIGKKENYRHCIKCNHCIHIDSTETHKCFAGTWNDCPICIDTLKDSTKPLFLLPCGHGTHTDCLRDYLQSDYRCPICKKSIGNMEHVWERIKKSLDDLRGNVDIQLVSTDGVTLKKECICNDCGENYETEKNVFNMYSCPKCHSFNSS